jgi:hypothetical protein
MNAFPVRHCNYQPYLCDWYSKLKAMLDVVHRFHGCRVMLASKSPRRVEILSKLGIAFTVVPSAFAEDMDWRTFPDAVRDESLMTRRTAASSLVGYNECHCVRQCSVHMLNLHSYQNPWHCVSNAGHLLAVPCLSC